MQPEPIYDAYEALGGAHRKTSARDLSDSAGAGFQPGKSQKNWRKKRIWCSSAGIMRGSMSAR